MALLRLFALVGAVHGALCSASASSVAPTPSLPATPSSSQSRATSLPANSQSAAWKRCVRETGVKRRLEALPGIGWDNLASVDMGQVIDITYDECKTTSDGQFLIPDRMFAIPVQKSQASAE